MGIGKIEQQCHHHLFRLFGHQTVPGSLSQLKNLNIKRIAARHTLAQQLDIAPRTGSSLQTDEKMSGKKNGVGLDFQLLGQHHQKQCEAHAGTFSILKNLTGQTQTQIISIVHGLQLQGVEQEMGQNLRTEGIGERSESRHHQFLAIEIQTVLKWNWLKIQRRKLFLR